MNQSHNRLRAFTIIELLVTIAIIALLTGIVITNLAPSKSRARDVKRISDMGNIQFALSLYFDRCKQYPSSLATTANTGCPTTPTQISLGSFISTIPTSPAPGSYVYQTSGTPPSDYVLAVYLENYNEILKDDIDGTVFGSIQCGPTNDSSEHYYCLGPK